MDGDRSDEGGDTEASGASEEERQLARDLVESLRAGRKIEAVKRYREATGSSLSEAVAFVNRIAREHGIAQSSGCGTSSALLVAATLWLRWCVG